MREPKRRSGMEFLETLPIGDWKMRLVEIGGVETVVLACPQHPARFYRDGKLIEININA